MPTNEQDEPYYDESEFNTNAGINDVASQDSGPSNHSSLLIKPSNEEESTAPKQHIRAASIGKGLNMDATGMIREPNSFENKSYEFTEVPLEKTESVSPNEDVKNLPPPTITVIQQDTSDKSTPQKFASIEHEKRCIIKNLLIICMVFMLLFTAFQSMSALQSSINAVGSLCCNLGQWK